MLANGLYKLVLAAILPIEHKYTNPMIHTEKNMISTSVLAMGTKKIDITSVTKSAVVYYYTVCRLLYAISI